MLVLLKEKVKRESYLHQILNHSPHSQLNFPLIIIIIFFCDGKTKEIGISSSLNFIQSKSGKNSRIILVKMEFTEAYKQTGPCCFSPNARYIAVAVDYRLMIRDTLSFKVQYFQFFLLFLLIPNSFAFFVC